MNQHDEIKQLLAASRKLLQKTTISEENDIRRRYGLSLLREQNDDDDINNTDGSSVYQKDNVMKSIDNSMQSNTGDNSDGSDYETRDNKPQKYQAYRISGGVIAIYGNDESQLEITNAEKSAFQETMDEFRSEVSDLVDLDELNVYPDNVEWSGKLISYKVKFTYSIGENGGTYVEGTMLKLDDEFMDFLNKLKGYYEKFKAKWGAIVSSRKETDIDHGDQQQ